MSSEETTSGEGTIPGGAVATDEPVLDCPPPGVELIHLTAEELLEPDPSYLRCAILEEGRPLHGRGPFAETKRRHEARTTAGEIVFEDGRVCFPEG